MLFFNVRPMSCFLLDGTFITSSSFIIIHHYTDFNFLLKILESLLHKVIIATPLIIACTPLRKNVSNVVGTICVHGISITLQLLESYFFAKAEYLQSFLIIDLLF